MNSETNKLHSVMKERKAQYEIIQAIYSEPLSLEVYQKWKEQTPTELEQLDKHYREFFEELAINDVEEVFNKERENYLQLFFGPGHIPAPPWESVYRTKEKLLFGDPTLSFRKKLREFNLYYDGESKEPEDHISVELEFMIYLIDQCLFAIENEREVDFKRALQGQFSLLDDHLINWVEQFTNDIASSTTSFLYRGSANFLRNLIFQDYQYLSEIKEVLNHE